MINSKYVYVVFPSDKLSHQAVNLSTSSSIEKFRTNKDKSMVLIKVTKPPHAMFTPYEHLTYEEAFALMHSPDWTLEEGEMLHSTKHSFVELKMRRKSKTERMAEAAAKKAERAKKGK